MASPRPSLYTSTSTPTPTPPPSIVLVLGKTGVGKSTFIKYATGLEITIGHGISSSTADIQIYPIPDSSHFLIDTPGFDDPFRSDFDILKSIASCLADLHEGLVFEGQNVNLAGVIYVHAISDSRMTNSMLKNLNMLEKMVGGEDRRGVEKLVFTSTKWRSGNMHGMGEEEGEGEEDADEEEQMNEEVAKVAREGELCETYWADMIAHGAQVHRFEDSEASARSIVAEIASSGPFVPLLTREYVVEGKELYQTAAGRAIDEQLAKQRDIHEEALAVLEKEHSRAIATQDESLAENLRVQAQEAEGKLKVLEEEAAALHVTREEAQEWADAVDALLVQKKQMVGSVTSGVEERQEKHRARQKRAMRWFGRFAAMGSGIALAVLTHGAMAPVGLAIYGQVEDMCQQDKDREVKRKKMMLERQR